jgi:hypothetical protein
MPSHRGSRLPRQTEGERRRTAEGDDAPVALWSKVSHSPVR